MAVHAKHPGWVDTPGVRAYLTQFRALTRAVIRTPEQGADTLVWLLATPRTTLWSGPSGTTGRHVRCTTHVVRRRRRRTETASWRGATRP